MTDRDQLIRVMGQIATLLRNLVGGKDINGCRISAVSIETAAGLIRVLRELLDEYDRLVIDLAQQPKHPRNTDAG